MQPKCEPKWLHPIWRREEHSKTDNRQDQRTQWSQGPRKASMLLQVFSRVEHKAHSSFSQHVSQLTNNAATQMCERAQKSQDPQCDSRTTYAPRSWMLPSEFWDSESDPQMTYPPRSQICPLIVHDSKCAPDKKFVPKPKYALRTSRTPTMAWLCWKLYICPQIQNLPTLPLEQPPSYIQSESRTKITELQKSKKHQH